jgi:hypothetical protein
MKTAAALFFVLLFSAGAQVPALNSVYLLPMANGMDQYLANGLTSEGVFQVVTDPKRAEAIFADRLGEPFERRMAELFPPEAPPAPKPEAKEKKQDEEEAEAPPAIAEAGPPRLSSFSRAKGNIFLVDLKTRTVLWSAYERPRNTTPDELNRTAKRIIDRLKKSFPKKT